ncbi:beta-1,4-glucuronyltransferase 1-like [Culicoides brevitarsis]|uniref:beta-1,4-glucuronyltransferase 1-like n=1 Tax=Culicoides brevitarsis TaxID=469753 RepID=UPI00307C923B
MDYSVLQHVNVTRRLTRINFLPYFMSLILVVATFYAGRYSKSDSCVRYYDESSFNRHFLQENATTTEEVATNSSEIAPSDDITALRQKLNCYDKDNVYQIERRGPYWALKNYIPSRLKAKCHESITYTTHGDFSFLDNIIPLLKRWKAPISISIYCPGDDYEIALRSAIYLRKCSTERDLVKDFVTFHMFFERAHTPKEVVQDVAAFESKYECGVMAPFMDIPPESKYKSKQNLTYPINVGRNIAREAALTHFVLASDIELYPNPGVVTEFLRMYAKFESRTHLKEVFVLPIFEVKATANPPEDKASLKEMLKNKTAIPFHANICASCHSVPRQKEWIAADPKPNEMKIHATAKRRDSFGHWEPIYIGTHSEPLYEEMLSWEGKSDKMTQGYTLCILDYNFHVLSEGFLVHRPGIKTMAEARRPAQENINNHLLRSQIVPQIERLFGTRKGCTA